MHCKQVYLSTAVEWRVIRFQGSYFFLLLYSCRVESSLMPAGLLGKKLNDAIIVECIEKCVYVYIDYYNHCELDP